MLRSCLDGFLLAEQWRDDPASGIKMAVFCAFRKRLALASQSRPSDRAVLRVNLACWASEGEPNGKEQGCRGALSEF